ncbi:MAG: VWA domain-containing protein [Candidatus Nanohalobium sp.]
MKLVFYNEFFHLLFLLNGLVILVYFYYRNKKKDRAMKFGNFKTLKKVAGNSFLQTDDLLLLTRMIGITLLIIGISNPVLIQEKKVSESNYAVLLDSSGSMFTSDIKPTRFQAAKQTAKEFTQQLPNSSKVGLVTFSGAVGTRKGLTSNHNRITSEINDLNIGETNAAGTAMGDAISAGVTILRDSSKPGRILLLTDGTNNKGLSLEKAAEKAAKANVSIHAVGLGEKNGSSQSYGILEGRNVSKADTPNLNPEELKMLADKTSGNVSIVTNSTALSEAVSVKKKPVETRFHSFFIIGGAALLVIEWMLKATDLEVLP